ncbi:hypothetical protein VP01_17g1 [Puccinia sorghi]|uniref:Cyclin N-terminal domain-containing protein n=1 Tax=Puccinia sorghi TaxID=27349 RepID=A0A0L6VEE3_9BASI|nr:hypothetical protein VP01_17g1 [Puccinia sorghi]
MVASKFLLDRNYSNKAWSKISGLPVEEINDNERLFLRLIDYRIHLDLDGFQISQLDPRCCHPQQHPQQHSPISTHHPKTQTTLLTITSNRRHPNQNHNQAHHNR